MDEQEKSPKTMLLEAYAWLEQPNDKRDDERCEFLFRQAIDARLYDGYVGLGKLALAHGDYGKARLNFLSACLYSLPEGQYQMGLLFRDGLGVKQSDDKAKGYLLAAKRAGHSRAAKALENYPNS